MTKIQKVHTVTTANIKKITYILVVTMWSRTDYSSSIHVAYLNKMKVSLEKIYDTVAVNVEKIVLLLS